METLFNLLNCITHFFSLFKKDKKTNNQEIRDVNNSIINQVNGNINIK
jgi:hypothetical protein